MKKDTTLLRNTFPLRMTRYEKKKLEDYAWENRKSMNEVLRDLINSL